MDRKVAVIAGGEEGVGYLVAKGLAATHRVVVVDIHSNGVDLAAVACGPDALGVECNVIDQTEVESAVATIVGETGGIDLVVSTAGIGIGGSLRHTPPDVVAAQVNVNLTGIWRFIRACLPHVTSVRATSSGLPLLLRSLRLRRLAATARAKRGSRCCSRYCVLRSPTWAWTSAPRTSCSMKPRWCAWASASSRRSRRRSPTRLARCTRCMNPSRRLRQSSRRFTGATTMPTPPATCGNSQGPGWCCAPGPGLSRPSNSRQEVNALTLTSVTDRGSFDGAVVPTAACKAAAQSVGRDIELPDEVFDRSPVPG